MDSTPRNTATAATSRAPLRLGAYKKSPQRIAAIERVQEWTRTRFSLEPEAPVLVSELTCRMPGCPPLETVVAFWLDTGERRHFKVFKPIETIEPDDIPPAWMKNSLCSIEGSGFECC